MAEMDREKKSRVLTVPNLLSAFRLLLVPVIVWLYCGEENYPLTACALLLSGATDIADGFIARRFHMVSDLGKVLDPVADKLTQAAALACLLTRFPAVWWLLGVLMGKEIIMASMGIFVIRRTGVVHGAEWHGASWPPASFTPPFSSTSSGTISPPPPLGPWWPPAWREYCCPWCCTPSTISGGPESRGRGNHKDRLKRGVPPGRPFCPPISAARRSGSRRRSSRRFPAAAPPPRRFRGPPCR